MKILLIYPSQLDEIGRVVKYRVAYNIPPLNLAILARLTPERHEVTIVNDFVEEIDFDGDYDLVGLTAMTAQAPRAYSIADRMRSKGVKVVIGGIHASTLPEEAAQHADCVVVGEAETLWETLLEDLDAGQLKERYSPDSYPTMDRVIIPKWDGYNLSTHRIAPGCKIPRMPIFTTRGCLHDCDFCTVTKYFGRTHRHKPIANVLQEIETTNAETYFFVDDNIISEPDYAEELFKALSKKNIRFTSQASTLLLKHPKLIDLAAKAGCRSLFLGIESIHSKALKSMKKGFNKPEIYPELFDRLERAGIRPLAGMILGTDLDTPETIEETIAFFIKHKAKTVYFSIYTPLPGTVFYNQMVEEGRLIDNNWSNYDFSHVVYQPKNFTPEELLQHYWNAYEQLYSLGKITQRTLVGLKSLHKDKMKFVRDAVIQYHYYSQIKKRENPVTMGAGRIKK